MLKNYFKIAWRNLTRKKGYTAINITGLTVGVACCILIALYVKGELSYDNFHTNNKEIYRVAHAYQSGSGGKKAGPAPEEYQIWGNAPIGAALLEEFPEIKKVVQFTSPSQWLLQYGDKRLRIENITFADSTMFDVFSWKMVWGNPATALKAPYSIVLSRSTARKFFGNENPVGKSFKADNVHTFNVTGVMEDMPQQSHIDYNGFISMSTFVIYRPEIFKEWGYIDFYTYFQTEKGVDIASLQAKVPGFIARRNPQDKENYHIQFEPLKDAYLHSRAARQPGVTGSLTNVYIFSVIGLFTLLIACINFMNLSTARSLERAKEVGVRKAVGANRLGLVYQFLTESMMISFAAVVLGVVLAVLLMPVVSDTFGKILDYRYLLTWGILPLLILMPVILGLLAGSYPAWVLTHFRPMEVLRGKFRSSGKGVMLRKGLVVVQFSLSIALIAGTAVVYSQLDHLQSHDLGFNEEQMLVIDYGGDSIISSKIEAIKAMLSANPDVLAASASRSVPGDFIPNAYTTLVAPTGEMKGAGPLLYEIDADFIPMYNIKMVAGRAYSRDFPSDLEQGMVLNEAAARDFGYAHPADIIGKRFEQWGRKGTVIGVVKDFNYESLHKKIGPLTLRMAPAESLNKISLRIKGDHINRTIAELERTWNQLAPQRPFLYTFMDQSFNLQYREDGRFGKMFGAFSILTILIACLGLFGLATYATEQREKEIGIRKVLGGSVGSIVRLLSSDFVKLVLIAILIATPVSWWVMNRWLEGFPYHINIQWWIFALAGILAISVALLTVSSQAIKAALADPVKSLKAE
ncbi:ABC transporter permease [Chitinophaga nivalis]|uniref:ABC transporter permease n=1 Tax=Chitinophaga nivalis TaxID=2991709 RepID=A0ABT3IQU8_9BACT|nr:ABC transporter permease [Chitinophaga nivalis]MCW3463953.1 ABC transporter permease [Chitinophaga nivalis]MCW3486357.1 ABC transporter permease [Chitinophaga nivalis]